MNTMKTKLALAISVIVSINLVASAIPAQSAEIQLRDMHTAEFCAPNVYLGGMDLSYTDFSGCDLTGAIFHLSDLTGANFDGAILRSSEFIGANMAGSFVSADLYGSTLTSATLSGNFERVNLEYASMEFSRLLGEFREANLSNAFIANAELSGSFVNTNLSGAPAYNATLSGTFTNANFTSTILQTANLFGEFADSSFYATQVRGATLGGNFARVSFESVTIDSSTSFTGNFPSANFRGLNLTSSTLSGNFDDADFTDSVLNDARLQGSFQRSNFERTSFANSFLGGNFDAALFTDQILDKFVSANLTGSFVETTFSNTNFAGTNLSQADLSQSIFNAPITGYFGTDVFPKALPKGWTYCGLYGGYFFGPGQNLSNTTLGNGSFCDVSSVNWRGTNVGNSPFIGLSFVGSNLSELMFNNNNFAQVDFSGAKITRRLSGTNFQQVKFVNSDMTESALDRSTMYGVDFSNANLENIDFSSSNLSQVNFSGANLAGVDFSGSNLSQVDFSGANLAGIDFSDSTLYGVTFTGANLGGVDFSGANVSAFLNLDCQNKVTRLGFESLKWGTGFNCEFRDLTLRNYQNITFSRSKFTNVTFDGSGILADLNFSESLIEDSTFNHPNGGSLSLIDVLLKNVSLNENASYSGSIFDNVQFDNVILKSLSMSIFRNSDMRGFRFQTPCYSCSFDNVDLSGAVFLQGELSNSIFKNSNLRNVDFSSKPAMNLSFGNVNVDGANLSDSLVNVINLGGVSGTPLHMDRRFQIKNGLILGPTAVLNNLDLSNLDFSNADLTYATMTDSNLSGARLAGAKSLFGINAFGLLGQPATLKEGYTLLTGRLVGPGVYINSADFRGVDFGESDLSFATIAGGTSLQGANLSRVKLVGTSICSVFVDSATRQPAKASFIKSFFTSSGFLAGPGTIGCSSKSTAQTATWPYWFINGGSYVGFDFSSSNLKGLDLRNGDFSGGDFRKADLSSVNFRGSDFSGADLRGSNMTGTDLAGATLDGALMTGILGVPEYLPTGWEYSNGSIVRAGSQVPGMKLSNSKCASGSEELAIDGETHLSLLGDASYSNTLSMDTTQGFNAKGSCMVWFIDGAAVPSANKLSFTPSKLDIGKKVRVGVVRTNASGTKTIQLSDELIVGKARMNSAVPTVSGVAKVGGRLTALRTTWAPGASYSYQWFRNGTVIEGATKVSYLPNAEDFQQTLAVKVCATKAYFETKCETSSASAQVAPGGFPKSPVVQLVAGKLTVGSTLVGKPGNWLNGTSLSFQWLRDGIAIQGANLANYTLSSEDRGHVIQFQVTATKRGYIDQVKSSITKSIP